MRAVILGGGGMLAHDVARRFGADAVPVPRSEVDLVDRAALDRAVADADLVVNCAAFTDVDGAEADPEAAFAVNATGAGNAASAAAAAGAGFVQVSTDYVFDGRATSPYDEDAPLRPLGVYGASKAEGEERVRTAHPAALVVRTAWLYGAAGRCFPRTILGLAHVRPTLSVVEDQTGQPTWTVDVADAIARLVEARAPGGVYHATNSGSTTWYEFARAIFEESGLDPARVEPGPSAALSRPAPRPAFSVLGHVAWRRIGLHPPRDWRSALHAATLDGALEVG